MVRIPAAPDFCFAADGAPSPITHSYRMGKYPVTNAEYAAFCKATTHPVPRYWKNGTYPDGKGKRLRLLQHRGVPRGRRRLTAPGMRASGFHQEFSLS